MLGLVATIISSLWPTLTILWLYHVQRTVSWIGITIGMTALLGVVLQFTGNKGDFWGDCFFRHCRSCVHWERQWQVNFPVMEMA